MIFDHPALAVLAAEVENHARQRTVQVRIERAVSIHILVFEAVNRPPYRVAEHQPFAHDHLVTRVQRSKHRECRIDRIGGVAIPRIKLRNMERFQRDGVALDLRITINNFAQLVLVVRQIAD